MLKLNPPIVWFRLDAKKQKSFKRIGLSKKVMPTKLLAPRLMNLIIYWNKYDLFWDHMKILWRTSFTLKKKDGQAFRSAKVQTSARDSSHGLNLSFEFDGHPQYICSFFSYHISCLFWSLREMKWGQNLLTI